MSEPDVPLTPRPQPRPRPAPAPAPPALPPPSAPPTAPAPATAPAHQHRVAMAVLVSVALVLAGVVVWLVIRTDTSGAKRVALPVRFTGYVRADRDADVVRAVRALLPADVASSAAGGGYARDAGSGPTPVAVVVVSAATLADSGASVDTFPDLVARNARSAPYVTSTAHGTLICGRATLAGASRTVCGWGDNRTSGLFVASTRQPSPRDLAAVVQRFLAEVEH